MLATNRGATGASAPSRAAAHRQLVGALCVVFTALGWGLNWPATKLLIVTCPPMSARGFSGLVACVLLFALAAVSRETLTVARTDWGRLVLGGLLNVTVWMGGTTASLRWLPAGQAVTLAYTMPIWVCLLAWPVLQERPTIRQVAAIAMGATGIIVLVGLDSLAFQRADAPGIALALLAAILFAFSTVYGKMRPLALPPLSLTAWQVGIGSIPLAVFGFIFEAPDFAALTTFGWAALAYTAAISMGLCYVLWFMARSRLSAPAAATGTLLTPVIGVIASALALGDALTWNQLIALGLVTMGIVLASRPVAAATRTP
ncbi:MAG: DMT family transporter [Proteobacteria bacterium]|nr:DMT family transporter [Pseudomonadota bacterium]